MSVGMRQGNWLFRPMTRLRDIATINAILDFGFWILDWDMKAVGCPDTGDHQSKIQNRKSKMTYTATGAEMCGCGW
jgi:hypothetical protein